MTDMKAGVAAALLAAREASRLGLAGDVVVAAVADEEHASASRRRCAASRPMRQW
jgi:acetylornithine deacetylase/succinyl-diaminopimelate desuccinylase-like protein